MSNRFDPPHKLASERNAAIDAVAGIPSEVTTGGRRRRWSSAEKARIIGESQEPGAIVSEVAQRYGLSRGQLYAWRRRVREAACSADERGWPAGTQQNTGPKSQGTTGKGLPAFARVVMAAPSLSSPAPEASLMEVAIGDVSVRVRGRVDVEGLVAVLSAVRRTS